MADKQTPFADPPAPKTRADPVDWPWVEQPPTQGQSLVPTREPSRGFDHIPGDTFRAATAVR